MAKINDIRQLAELQGAEVSRSPRDWMQYLDTAAKLYRYSFTDNLLIHAQRPEATACAELEQWNEKMHRWVNKGAKGIALLDDTGPRQKVRYVFDIADTHMVRGGMTPYLWKLEERHEGNLLDHLVDAYGLDAANVASLQDAIQEIAQQLTEENLEEAMEGLEYELADTFLEDLGEEHIRMNFRNLMINSAFYTICRRCGLEPMAYLEEEDFIPITDFNRLSVLSFVGNATSDMAEPVLRDIGKTIRNFYREEIQNTVANTNSMTYNEFNTLKRESETVTEETEDKTIIENGGNEYGTDLSSQGRLSISEPGSDRGASDNREVRDASEDISEGEQEELVPVHAADRETEPASDGRGTDSTEEDGNTDRTVSEDLSGTGQSDRPDGVGGLYQQFDSHGRGEHLDGVGVQLSEEITEQDLSEAEEEIASALSLPELPTANEQIRKIEERMAALYAGEITIPPDVVDEVLRTGSNHSQSQLRIIYNFMIEQTPEEYTDFVRLEYGKGGKGFEINGTEYSVWFDELGMQIAVGHTVNDQILNKAFLSWKDVSGRIKQLLDQGEYAPQVVLDAARGNALKEHAQVLAYMENDMAEGVAELVFADMEIFNGGYPDKVDRLAGLLAQPEFLSDLNERLEGVAEIYEVDKSIMRFHYYRPDKVAARFQKFAGEAIPYHAREDFAWQPQKIFITQDEVDAFLSRGGAYSNGRLTIYSFYLLHSDAKERADFIKEQYGTGGCSHALSGADTSHANYDAKGLSLERGNYGNPDAKLLLKWPQVAKRIEYLMEQDKFLTAADYTRMPEYERERIVRRIANFYSHMPEEIEIPFTLDFFHEEAVKEINQMILDPEKAQELVQKMDAALAAIPLDYRDYENRAKTLSDVHQYLDGNYTIFPIPEKEPESVESIRQMNLFDFFSASELSGDNEPAKEEQKEEWDGEKYQEEIGNFLYLDADDHLYQIERISQFDVFLKDMQNPFIEGRVISRREHAFDKALSENPMNDHLIVGGNPLLRDSRTIYKECMYTMWAAVRQSEAYDLVRSRDMDEDTAFQIIKDKVQELADLNRENAPVIANAVENWENFSDWLSEDIFQRTYQDFAVTSKDAVDLYSDNTNSPEWMRGLLVEADWQVISIYTSEQEVVAEVEAAEEQMVMSGQEDIAEQQTTEEQDTAEKQDITENIETEGGIPDTGQPSFEEAKELWENGYVYDDYVLTSEIGSRMRESMEEAGVSFDDFSQEQMEVIRQAAERDSVLEPMLNPEFPPEQMQLITDVVDRMLANEKRWFQSEVDVVAGHVMTPDEVNAQRRKRHLPLEDVVVPETEVVQEAQPIELELDPINFHISDIDLGAGGPKAKFRANMNAIYLLQELEEAGKKASQEEQEMVLSKYVGWGGIPSAFDFRNGEWAKEAAELKNALMPDEYEAARASTLNAFYTSPTVIQAMYQALENMGLKQGNILEPACGVGNFMGLVPESMAETKMYGVELDSISGRIARQLYQKNPIAIQGFETTDFSENFFDCVIGNVPFGDYKVVDRKYDRYNFLIHDYFIGKSLDLVRPGGVVAVVTSSGTMDKQNSSARQYLANRGDLLGAIRLPNNAFQRNANTNVVADILFFQKRDRASLEQPGWVNLAETPEGYSINSYFVEHPEMVLGEFSTESTQYGKQAVTVKAIEGADLAEQLKAAVSRIRGTITEYELEDEDLEDVHVSIPANPEVKNFSFANVDGKVYYRENSRMNLMELPKTTTERVLGMIELRNLTQELINCQMNDGSDAEIANLQGKLNTQYEAFTAQYGLLSNTANRRAFSQDSSYCLLSSLELVDENGKLKQKADIFTKRTIRKAEPVTSVDTASEALAVCIGEKAKVDIPFMAQLAGKTEEEITEELTGVIFQNPLTDQWEASDEYLSGNVREKLDIARKFAENHPEYQINVQCLERVQPKELEASEIEVRLGATWVKAEYITQFMGETFHTPRYSLGSKINVSYAEITGQWNISGKTQDYNNPIVNSSYGTQRANAYRLLEDALNLKDTKIYDTVTDDEGREKRVLNRQQTVLAQQKQDLIKDAFKDWIFKDIDRREDLCQTYNELFNSIRPREYDGSHIQFHGMTPEISLMSHQKNAVAHVLYGNNTLLAHCVGAGKTFQMIAAGMESKRLGLAQKCLYVVPNHLTEQWGADFLRLYPGANVLVSTKKDFEPANRKRFCSRIATGDYDGAATRCCK